MKKNIFVFVFVISGFIFLSTPLFADYEREAANIMSNAQTISKSSFSGQSGHKVSGDVKLVKTKKAKYVVLENNFSFDGAPDPRIGFSKNGKYIKASTVSPLNMNKGYQVYRLPKGFDVSNYDEVTIWCEAFSVPLGKASIK